MLKTSLVDPLVKMALKEDVGSRDITSSALIPRNLAIKAEIEFKQSGVICGIEVAERVFRLVDENLRFLPVAKDGEWVEKGREVAYIEGLGTSILIAERTALNFISHNLRVFTSVGNEHFDFKFERFLCRTHVSVPSPYVPIYLTQTGSTSKFCK